MVMTKQGSTNGLQELIVNLNVLVQWSTRTSASVQLRSQKKISAPKETPQGKTNISNSILKQSLKLNYARSIWMHPKT
jgi:hypothetical protein